MEHSVCTAVLRDIYYTIVRRDCRHHAGNGVLMLCAPTLGMISKSLLVPIIPHCQGSSHVFAALFDSGAKGKAQLAAQLRLPVISLDVPLSLSAVDGDPVGQGFITQTTQPVKMDVSALQWEELRFFVLDSSDYAIILVMEYYG